MVFTPKYRRGPFTDEILVCCEEVMRDICTDFGAELTKFNVEADHVHLLVHYLPKVALSRPGWSAPSRASPPAACARSSHPTSASTSGGDHFWSPSYFAVSAGGAPLKVIKEYIENQKRPG
ncbi:MULTISPECIES: IS200/IS605 family transposase [unclassified Streptomyces]|uniref:IS200/IS605 family transposase n=1 Tax=unclassified Streptomyces TaxID=2593676 RepID=UPI0036EA5295